MEIKLNAEQREFVRRAVETGRVRREEDAIKQALSLWIERERQREELLALIDEAEASVAAGKAIAHTKESIRELAEDVKRRGRERLAAGKKRAHG
jgi:Arc/MetJ-type ribon-helix-helix transcriptional regulator